MGRPRSPDPKHLVAVRLVPGQREALGEEATRRGVPVSEVMRLCMARYLELAWRELPALRDVEWCAVFDALGAPAVELAGLEWVGATVARALDHSDVARKWKVDGGKLAERARAWTFGQQCAVADAAMRFRVALPAAEDPLVAARAATTRPVGVEIAPRTPGRGPRR